jgi:hypothetical protein
MLRKIISAALAGAVALTPVVHACTGMICDILHIRLAEMR